MSLKVAEEVLSVLGIQDEDLAKHISNHTKKAASELKVDEEKLAAEFRRMLELIESKRPDEYREFMKNRCGCFRENRDLMIITYEIEGNSKK